MPTPSCARASRLGTARIANMRDGSRQVVSPSASAAPSADLIPLAPHRVRRVTASAILPSLGWHDLTCKRAERNRPARLVRHSVRRKVHKTVIARRVRHPSHPRTLRTLYCTRFTSVPAGIGRRCVNPVDQGHLRDRNLRRVSLIELGNGHRAGQANQLDAHRLHRQDRRVGQGDGMTAIDCRKVLR